jgi:predicted NACHT family NTPase
VVSIFENADDLARKLSEAVVKWGKESGQVGKRQLTDWEAYRNAIYEKHQWVRLQVIAGASKDRGIAKIPLAEVFSHSWRHKGHLGPMYPTRSKSISKQSIAARQRALTDENREPKIVEETVEPEAEEPLLSSNSEVVLDILGREPTQVILGGPGSGKSTILHYAMLRVCEAGIALDILPIHLQDAPVPFLIELRQYVLRKTPEFVSYIVGHSEDFYGTSIDAESLIELLAKERAALVLFDGLDEVFDPDERRRVIDQFQTFARRYPKACIVVTSRIAGYDRTALGLADFKHYTLLPLTLGHIRHFAEQWYQYYTLQGTERTAEGLVQRIIENPRLLDLAGNPLLLTMMAVIYKDRDLPNERWRLYERCAETLLEDWDVGRGFEDEDFKLAVRIKTAQKSEILHLVFMYTLEHNQQGRELNAIAYDPLLTIMAGYLEDRHQRSPGEAEAVAVDILHHLMERTYVLAGIGERIFGFVRRTFMEYFAACRC